jgi:RHS repeat-associated protein
MSSQQPNLLCLYGYDPLDRLIDHSQTGSSRLQRFYCKSRLATEIQGTLEHSIFQHDDQLLAQRGLEGDICVNALLATDQQRSVLHTLDKNSAPMPIAYSPYGHRHGESGLISLLGFNGERPDPITGHYLLGNGYRAFNPVLMRFNSPDSLSPFGAGGFNPYVYCLGDPVNRYDPTGHVTLLKVLARRKAYKPIYTKFGSVPPSDEVVFKNGKSASWKMEVVPEMDRVLELKLEARKKATADHYFDSYENEMRSVEEMRENLGRPDYTTDRLRLFSAVRSREPAYAFDVVALHGIAVGDSKFFRKPHYEELQSAAVALRQELDSVAKTAARETSIKK